MITEIALLSCKNSGIAVLFHIKSCDLEYADDVVLLSKDTSMSQVFLDRVNDGDACLGCVLYHRSIRCCCKIGLTQNRNLFSQEKNWMKSVGLNSRIIASCSVVVCQIKRILVYRRLDSHSPIYSVSGIGATSDYRPKVAVLQQQCGHYFHTVPKHSPCE